jgi:hypothetical protein
MPECTKPIDQVLAAAVEILVDVLQPFGGDGLDADQRALDARFLHGGQKLRILGGFHRDLGEKHHVVWQRGEPFHQLEALGAHRLELLEAALVLAARRHRQVFEGHRIEVIVGKGDEAEPPPPQIHDLVDHGVDGALPGALAVGLPHRAEGAMLGAAANRLDRRPHVLAGRNQRPAGRLEVAAFDFAAVVHRARRLLRAIGNHLRPHQIAVAFDDRVRAAERGSFLGVQRRVNAAKDDIGAAGARDLTDFVSLHGVAGMNANADHIAGRDSLWIPGFERFVGDERIAVHFGGRCREHV